MWKENYVVQVVEKWVNVLCFHQSSFSFKKDKKKSEVQGLESKGIWGICYRQEQSICLFFLE